jgi:hypothetical protein
MKGKFFRRTLSVPAPAEAGRAHDRAMRSLLATAAIAALLVASLAAAAPSTATKQVRRTSGPVLALAADGDRAAFIVRGRFEQCMSVMVWEPQRHRARRLQAARDCETKVRGTRTGPPAVALAGTRAVWLQMAGGNLLETVVRTATVARPTPVYLAVGSAEDGVVGTFARPPAGDRSLLAFTIDKNCLPGSELNPCPPGHESGGIIEAIVWRFGGKGHCPWVGPGKPVPCSPIAKADNELTVLAVDAGRIAARTARGIKLLTGAGRVVRDIAIAGVERAALSGKRLAVQTANAIELYDSDTGQLTARFPSAGGVRLEDLDRDILVTASGGTVTLRRLGDRRTSTFRVGGRGLGQLERPGLFLAGGRRVTFIPMRDVLRRFIRA